MQKILFCSISALVFVASIYSCKKTSDPPAPAGLLGDTLTIFNHQSVAISNSPFNVRFQSVVGDSRCSSDGVCVWAGRVDVALLLSDASAEKTDTLSIAGLDESPKTDSTSAFGYNVKLIKVLPYPETPGLIPDADYNIKIIVTQ